MKKLPNPTTVAKSHYLILDGLRGVAAVVVVFYHLFKGYGHDDRFKQVINHGYLAVDFFFLLSGFVVAYAYDDRWNLMSDADFYKRRLIRLQPMVIMGTTIGAALFYLQAGRTFPHIGITPMWQVLLLMLLGYVMMPLPVPLRIHGSQEMYPLNGPAWSLFYEYIANFLYAVLFRKLSNRILGIFLLVAAAFLVHLAVFGQQGDLIGGFAFTPPQLHFGFARVLFSFLAGVLLMRSRIRLHVKGAFWICNALLVLTLSIPRLGGLDHIWLNGLYEAFCVVVIFPVIVALGASERITDGLAIRASRFLGDLSYPLYVTHSALINIYTAWAVDNKVSAVRGAVCGLFVLIVSMALAYACLKLYDEPVRKWLGRRFLTRSQSVATSETAAKR
jgi:peptidoglycan/LPS O-acetylase OafA/YrhL